MTFHSSCILILPSDQLHTRRIALPIHDGRFSLKNAIDWTDYPNEALTINAEQFGVGLSYFAVYQRDNRHVRLFASQEGFNTKVAALRVVFDVLFHQFLVVDCFIRRKSSSGDNEYLLI